MTGTERAVWLALFVFKEFLGDFARRLAEHMADRVARARHYIKEKHRRRR